MGSSVANTRLLTLQSRMHDLELKCMRYSNEEIVMTALSNNVSIKYNQMLEAANNIAVGYNTTYNTTSGSSSSTYNTLKLINGSNSVNIDYNLLKELGYDIAPKNSLATETVGEDGKVSYTYDVNDAIEEAKKDAEALIEAIIRGSIARYKNCSQVDLSSIGIQQVEETSGTESWTQTTAIQSIDTSARDAARQEAQNYYDTETKKISMQEKALQIKSKQAETEYSAACTEYESAKSLVSEDTKREFSIWS